MERSSQELATPWNLKNVNFICAEKLVHNTAISDVIYRDSVAVHFRCLLSTMEATSLPAPAE